MLSKKIKGISSLIGSILIHLIIGNIFSFSNFIPYLHSYLHLKNIELKKLNLYFIAPIGIAIHNALPSITGYLDHLLGTRILLLCAVILISISQFLMFTYTTKFYCMIISYILFGIGNSFTYFQTMKNCWKYFPNKKGLITGIILSSFGLSAFIFTSIGDFIINKDHIEPINGYYQKEICEKFITYTKFFFWCVVIFGFIAVLLVFPYDIKYEEELKESIDEEFESNYKILPTDSDSNNSNSKPNTNNVPTNNNSNGDDKDDYPSLFKCLYSLDFLICLITVGCTLLFGFLLTNTYRTFGKEKGINDSILQNLSKCFTLTNTFTRILWGLILDKFGFTIPYLIVCINQVICSFFLCKASNNANLYFLVCCFGVFSFAGHVTIFPNVINKKFGVDNSVVLLGICGILGAISCLLGPILTIKIIKDLEDYEIIYLIGSICSAISAFFTLFIKYEKKKA